MSDDAELHWPESRHPAPCRRHDRAAGPPARPARTPGRGALGSRSSDAERRPTSSWSMPMQGWDGLLPWTPVDNPVPLVALLGSEAPGRIAWALDQGADAIIAKPVAASAVYPALVMATRRHAEAASCAARIASLEERVRLRPLVHAAVQAIMAARRLRRGRRLSAILRREAMRRRLTLEQVAASDPRRPDRCRRPDDAGAHRNRPPAAALFRGADRDRCSSSSPPLAAPWLAPFSPDDQPFDGLSLEGAPLPPGAAVLARHRHARPRSPVAPAVSARALRSSSGSSPTASRSRSA